MRWMLGLGLVLVAACGAKPPEPVDNAAPTAPVKAKPAPKRLGRHARPRPAIDIGWLRPEFHDELRWPLTGMSHPSLEPRFAIAEQLADPGITWEELCARGVHRRMSASQRDLLMYLHGWCDVQTRDVDAACAHLTPLLTSVTRGLTAAVRQDLANILVDQGDADKAEHWLEKHKIRDTETLDLLTANYAELGSLAAVFELNRRAIVSDDHATDATKCRRLARGIATGIDPMPLSAINELKDLATTPKVPNPTCERLHHKVACSVSWNHCQAYYTDEAIEVQQQWLVDAYYTWPVNDVDYKTWFHYAVLTSQALPTLGAAELAVAALEEAHRAANACPKDLGEATRDVLATVRKLTPNLEYEPRLQKLETACSGS